MNLLANYILLVFIILLGYEEALYIYVQKNWSQVMRILSVFGLLSLLLCVVVRTKDHKDQRHLKFKVNLYIKFFYCIVAAFHLDEVKVNCKVTELLKDM